MALQFNPSILFFPPKYLHHWLGFSSSLNIFCGTHFQLLVVSGYKLLIINEGQLLRVTIIPLTYLLFSLLEALWTNFYKTSVTGRCPPPHDNESGSFFPQCLAWKSTSAYYISTVRSGVVCGKKKKQEKVTLYNTHGAHNINFKQAIMIVYSSLACLRSNCLFP